MACSVASTCWSSAAMAWPSVATRAEATEYSCWSASTSSCSRTSCWAMDAACACRVAIWSAPTGRATRTTGMEATVRRAERSAAARLGRLASSPVELRGRSGPRPNTTKGTNLSGGGRRRQKRRRARAAERGRRPGGMPPLFPRFRGVESTDEPLTPQPGGYGGHSSQPTGSSDRLSPRTAPGPFALPPLAVIAACRLLRAAPRAGVAGSATSSSSTAGSGSAATAASVPAAPSAGLLAAGGRATGRHHDGGARRPRACRQLHPALCRPDSAGGHCPSSSTSTATRRRRPCRRTSPSGPASATGTGSLP